MLLSPIYIFIARYQLIKNFDSYGYVIHFDLIEFRNEFTWMFPLFPYLIRIDNSFMWFIRKKREIRLYFDYILGGETFIIIHFVNMNCIRKRRSKKKSATPRMLQLIVIYSRTKSSNGRLNREIKEKRKLSRYKYKWCTSEWRPWVRQTTSRCSAKQKLPRVEARKDSGKMRTRRFH